MIRCLPRPHRVYYSFEIESFTLSCLSWHQSSKGGDFDPPDIRRPGPGPPKTRKHFVEARHLEEISSPLRDYEWQENLSQGV